MAIPVTMLLRAISFFMCLACIPAAAWAADAFEIRDIRLEGLQRIAPGTVFTYLPLRIGETVDEQRSAEILRTLYQTGFFKDIRLARDGDVLVLDFVERPSIATISFSGNEDISEEQLNAVLKDVGLIEGRIFNRSLLEKIQQELERQYFSQGKYGVEISSSITEVERNRVEIKIEIKEGEAARIHQVRIIGNKAFTTERLQGDFELGEKSLLAPFSSRDKYSKQKLVGDLEVLRSYYLDRGYIDFTIESTQVSIAPDKQGVYITVNLTEGDQYSVSEVKLAGDLIVPEAELHGLLQIAAGEIFSRKAVTESSAAINDRLGQEGYAFANVNAVPDIDKENKSVSLTFFVDPGKRVYVRRINVDGNTKTHDEVIRREIRQMEGGWVSTQKINRSRTRIQRLGYIQDVNVETLPVANSFDQVDVNLKIKEGPSGSLQAGAGYGTTGAVFNLSVTEQNFLGTGKNLKLEFDNSRATTVYNLSYTNPYYTLDGISRGVSVYSRTTDAEKADVASYFKDEVGASVNYGFPLSEFNTARLGLSVEHTKIGTGSDTPPSITTWLAENADVFDTYKLNLTWTHDGRNRILFVDEGMLQRLTFNVVMPGSEIEYFTVNHKQQWYSPFMGRSILLLESNLGFGDGYGSTSELPFFENFYLGGINTVRGFRSNSLGPRENGKVIGGTRKVQGSMEVIMPSPFEEYEKSFRWSYFIDGGNVFGTHQDIDLNEFRASHGVAAQWMTPVGIMTFSYGWPLRSEPGDELQRFQFTIGAPF